jgi:hypothetical protein
MGSADGSTIALVLLVAVDGLNPTDFFVYPIPGMTLCVQGNTVGYLYFCATHVGMANNYQSLNLLPILFF